MKSTNTILFFCTLFTFFNVAAQEKSIEEMTLEEFKAAFKKSKPHHDIKSEKEILSEKRFGWIDTNKNGIIEKEESIKYFKGRVDKNGLAKDGVQFFYGYDHNNNNRVTLSEFKKGLDWNKMNAKFKN